MENERPPVRIGTAERTAAMRALDEHLEAGRLDVEEYGERSARASTAVTAPELAVLFDDLPAPHPPLPGVSRPVPVTASPSTPPARREPSTMEVWGPRLMALAPLIALALFLTTHAWFVFLLVPVMAVALGAGHHGHRGRRR
jgi:uncharacterized protein DUF1707